ncbi:hypothetical protein OROHE_013696 [Orobanche hederae]
MLRPEFVFLWLCVLIFGPRDQFCRADLGTASQYYGSPSYRPTACYGSDPMQFPTTDYFAAAGEDIWDRGAACGRQYLVQCLRGPLTQGCASNQTIQVKIVDRAQTSVSRPAVAGATLILSHTAFMAIANPAVHVVNSQYQQIIS